MMASKHPWVPLGTYSVCYCWRVCRLGGGAKKKSQKRNTKGSNINLAEARRGIGGVRRQEEIWRPHDFVTVERSKIEIRQIPPVNTMNATARPSCQPRADARHPRDGPQIHSGQMTVQRPCAILGKEAREGMLNLHNAQSTSFLLCEGNLPSLRRPQLHASYLVAAQ